MKLCFSVLIAITVNFQPLIAQGEGGERKIKFFANKSVDISGITMDDIKNYFLVEKTHWPNGKKVTLINFSKGTKTFKEFSSQILNMSEAKLTKYYMIKLFSGIISDGPLEVEDADEMAQLIKSTKGSIGYLPVDYKFSMKSSVQSIN